MKQHIITVDVHAHWSITPPTYRIFVDGDLLTERDFVWSGSDTYIEENIIVNLEPGTHKLNVQQVSGLGTITTKNVIVDGVASANEFTTTE